VECRTDGGCVPGWGSDDHDEGDWTEWIEARALSDEVLLGGGENDEDDAAWYILTGRGVNLDRGGEGCVGSGTYRVISSVDIL
jgi:hypothetical protein